MPGRTGPPLSPEAPGFYRKNMTGYDEIRHAGLNCVTVFNVN